MACKDIERENFRMFMRMFTRMYEKFSGCRVLSYCVMLNHFHLLLVLLPIPVEGIMDEELLKRLGAATPCSKQWRTLGH